MRNELLSMFLIAKDASDGMFGLCFIISKDKSLIDSIAATNSTSSFLGMNSSTLFILAVIYGFSETNSVISNLFFP